MHKILLLTGAPPGDPEAEEYAVYSALIRAWYIDDSTNLIVLCDQTNRGLANCDNLDERLDYVRQNLPGVPEEVVANFRAQNRQSYLLKPRFNLPVRYAFITDQQLHDMFQGNDGWDKFYKQYPGSQGTMTLSRVGFNAQMDNSLVYVGNQSHWKAGSGHVVFLVKENGLWRIQKKIMLWIS